MRGIIGCTNSRNVASGSRPAVNVAAHKLCAVNPAAAFATRSGRYTMMSTIAASKMAKPIQRLILLLTFIPLVSFFWFDSSQIAFQMFHRNWCSRQRTLECVARQQIAGLPSLDVNNTFACWWRRGQVQVIGYPEVTRKQAS